jgi:hypothetical protein
MLSHGFVVVKSNAIFVPAFNFSTNVCVFFLFGHFFIFDLTLLLMYLKLSASAVVLSLFILFVKAQPSVASTPPVEWNSRFPNFARFPEGLKPGIYSDAASLTCGGITGSYDFEEHDAATFAARGQCQAKPMGCLSTKD